MSLSKAVKCVLISCHAISVCLYLVRAQAIYNFAFLFQAICSSIEFCDTLYCEQASPTKLIPLNFALKFFGNAHAHLPHFQNLLFTSTWGVVCTYKFILELTDPCWVKKKCHVYTCFHSIIWLVPPDAGTKSWQLFPQMFPGSLLPLFQRRQPGNKAVSHAVAAAEFWTRYTTNFTLKLWLVLKVWLYPVRITSTSGWPIDLVETCTGSTARPFHLWEKSCCCFWRQGDY